MQRVAANLLFAGCLLVISVEGAGSFQFSVSCNGASKRQRAKESCQRELGRHPSAHAARFWAQVKKDFLGIALTLAVRQGLTRIN